MVRRKYPQAPVVAVGVVVFKGNKVLLGKRGHEPSKGKWSIPGGVVELGETLQEAAVREVREECGIEVQVGEVVSVLDNIVRDEEGRIRYHYVLVDLLAEHVAGEMAPASDLDDVRWVGEDELGNLDIPERTLKVLRKAFAHHIPSLSS